MISRNTRAVVPLVILGAVLAGGCDRQHVSTPANVRRDPNVVVAYVSCGFAAAMEAARIKFENDNKGKSVHIDAGEPSTLVERIRSGAVPDVLICPGEAEIGMLEREGYLDRGSRQSLGTLRLAIAVHSDNATRIRSFRDLSSSAVSSVTMPIAGTTSLGTDGKRALERAGIWSDLQDKLTLQATPLGALQRVASGEADAAVVYDPCFAMHTEGKIPPGSVRVVVPREAGDERAISVYVVVHKRSPNALLAQRFIRLLLSRELKPPAPPPPSPGTAPEEQE
ncbi:MAG: substrate-binding domain-containing protein [Armatimonadota bacterium]|nr:MAG: substrate-binding domain-containing protein [Armatimonadota bacterium]